MVRRFRKTDSELISQHRATERSFAANLAAASRLAASRPHQHIRGAALGALIEGCHHVAKPSSCLESIQIGPINECRHHTGEVREVREVCEAVLRARKAACCPPQYWRTGALELHWGDPQIPTSRPREHGVGEGPHLLS
jgi:hypothetical protein